MYDYGKIILKYLENVVPLHCDSRETRQDADSEKANRWKRKVLSPAELRLISGREKAYLSLPPKLGGDRGLNKAPAKTPTKTYV